MTEPLFPAEDVGIVFFHNGKSIPIIVQPQEGKTAWDILTISAVETITEVKRSFYNDDGNQK